MPLCKRAWRTNKFFNKAKNLNTMKSLFFIFLFTLCYVANSAIHKNDFQKKTDKKSSNEKVAAKAAAIKTLKCFFYTYNNPKDTFKLNYIKGEEGDSANPYRIDFDGVRAYFDYLKKTNLFSQKFFDDLLIYFKRCDSNFIVVKQYESIPLGFEYNIITKDMDDMGVEENVNKSIISSYKKIDNTVHLSLKFANFYTYTFVLTRYNGKWLVDNINGDFKPLYSKPV